MEAGIEAIGYVTDGRADRRTTGGGACTRRSNSSNGSAPRR